MRPCALCLVSALVAAVLAAGCGAGDGGDEAAAPRAAAEAQGDPAAPTPGTAACASPGAGFAVEYPADWHANEDDPAAPCTLFHPEPFRADAADPAAVAISLRREPVPYEEATTDESAGEVTALGDAVVGDRPATRLAYRGTGEGTLPEDARGYVVVVDLGEGETLTAATFEGDHDFEQSREVLDAIVDSLVVDD